MSDSSTRALGIVNSEHSKSEKIRALHREGLSIGDIARALNIKYQFAWNVINSPAPAREKPRTVEIDDFVQVRTQVGEGGRIVIPAALRTALGLNIGDDVLLRLEAGELHLMTPSQAIRRAQELVRQFVPEGRSLSSELLAERRLEAERE